MNSPLTDWYLRCPSCGGVAYWLRRKGVPFALLMPTDVLHADGTPALYGEVMACGTCGAGFPGDTVLREDAIRASSELGKENAQ